MGVGARAVVSGWGGNKEFLFHSHTRSIARAPGHTHMQWAAFASEAGSTQYLVHGLQLANDGQPDFGPVIFEQAEKERQQVIYRFRLRVRGRGMKRTTRLLVSSLRFISFH